MGARCDMQASYGPRDGSVGEGLRSIRFGSFEVVPGARALVRNGLVVDIGSRAFDILMVLLEARGEIVCKDHLIREVWPTTTVVDSNLKVQLSLLRRILGADRWRIKTISGRGYLFVVEEAGDLGSPDWAPSATSAASEGPLIIMIEAEPGTRELMAQAILELTRSFSAAGRFAGEVSAAA